MTIERIETRHGPIFVPSTDAGQYWWFKTAAVSPEDAYIEEVCALLDERPRGIAVDVGANFGAWTIPLARHAIKTIAFEPQAAIARLLERTVAANPDVVVIVCPCALGASAFTGRIPAIDLDDTTNFGGVMLNAAHPDRPDAPLVAVAVDTLDGLMLPEVSFVKIDVEGFEAAVLAGAMNTVKLYKPILFVEAVHPNTDTNALGRMIEGFGYNVEVKGNNFLGMPL